MVQIFLAGLAFNFDVFLLDFNHLYSFLESILDQ